MTDLLRRHRWIATALALGVVVRVLVEVTFLPAFIYSDGPTYLALASSLSPSPDRTIGYSLLLHVLALATNAVWLVAVVQHLLGLATAVLVYALLRRWGVSGKVAALATVPVLFDEMELVLEHSIMSDVLFDLLLVLGVAVLAWRRPPPFLHVAAGGVLLAAAVLVRVVGEPVVLAALVFVLAVATTLRGRLLRCAVLVLTFGAPLVGYAAWYHSEVGAWALSEAGGRALYMRTTAFVDCSVIDVPGYQRTLCPREPVGQRRDPTYYGWHDDRTVHAMVPPPGVTLDGALRDFAVTAIRTQPLDYAKVVARDFLMNFFPVRLNLFEYDTVYKWSFYHYVDYRPTDWTGPAYATYGGEQPSSLHPVADAFKLYGWVVYLSGTLLLALLVLAIVGLVRPRHGAPPTRPLLFLTTALGVGLMLAPALTAEFTWRYQLPALVFLPMGAALAWTRLATPRPSLAEVAGQEVAGQERAGQEGRTATPSTD
ncbi:MAG: hypothetical protein QOK15_1201 [Nocardioidaceae bacterium]|nr:hypothetical protein [Nocardioidaceae bacterium]